MLFQHRAIVSSDHALPPLPVAARLPRYSPARRNASVRMAPVVRPSASLWQSTSTVPPDCAGLVDKVRANFRRLAARKSGGRSATAASAVRVEGADGHHVIEYVSTVHRRDASFRSRGPEEVFWCDDRHVRVRRRIPPRPRRRSATAGGFIARANAHAGGCSRFIARPAARGTCARRCGTRKDFPGGWDALVRRRRTGPNGEITAALGCQFDPDRYARLALGAVGEPHPPDDWIDARARRCSIAC